jgi:GNAT superfamily N-acetyltransferase
MHIRKAAAADAEALHDLYQHHLTPNLKPIHAPEAQDMAVWRKKITGFENSPGYNVLVGELPDGTVVCSVTLIIIENLTRNMRPYAVIENVVTHSGHRGRGYASRLMERASETAAAAGCYKIMLMTGSKRDGTLSFYERCGYNRNDKTAFIKWL